MILHGRIYEQVSIIDNSWEIDHHVRTKQKSREAASYICSLGNLAMFLGRNTWRLAWICQLDRLLLIFVCTTRHVCHLKWLYVKYKTHKLNQWFSLKYLPIFFISNSPILPRGAICDVLHQIQCNCTTGTSQFYLRTNIHAIWCKCWDLRSGTDCNTLNMSASSCLSWLVPIPAILSVPQFSSVCFKEIHLPN